MTISSLLKRKPDPGDQAGSGSGKKSKTADLRSYLKYVDRSAVFVDAFEATYGQAHGNVESFNKFVETQVPQIIAEASTFEFNALEDERKHVVSFAMSSIGKPTLLHGDSERKETVPSEVEQLQETFSSEIMIDVYHEQYDLSTGDLIEKAKYVEYRLVPIPVMIGSNLFPVDDPLVANYVSRKNADLVARGRKPKLPADLMGYFVVNGNFKNIIAQTRVGNNVAYVHPVKKKQTGTSTTAKPKGPGDKPGDNIEKCEYRSWSENKMRSTSTLVFEFKRQKSESYEVQIVAILPFVKKVTPHVVALFRYLGVLDNERTIRMILGDRSPDAAPGEDPIHDNVYFVKCVRAMILQSHYSCMSPTKIAHDIAKGLNMTATASAQAHMFMRNDVDSDEEDAGKNDADAVEETVQGAESTPVDTRVSSVRHSFCSEFFPHVGTDNKPETCAKKIALLVNVVRRMLFVAFGIDGAVPDLRDDDPFYQTPGMLLSLQLRLFYRDTLKKFQRTFGRKVSNVFYKDKKTGETKRRDLNPLDSLTIKTLVQGIMTAMATGKWGKHKGTSQNGVVQQLPRNNNMSAISHLRRSNMPLPRESKDSRVRQLRNTDWGQKCPSDTPEGAACGLTNPFPVFSSVRLGYPSKTFVELLNTLRFDRETGKEDYESEDTVSLDPFLDLSKIDAVRQEAGRQIPDQAEREECYSATYCETDADPSMYFPDAFYDRSTVCFMVNGYPVGYAHERYCRYFEKALVSRRRCGMIPYDVTVDYDARKTSKSATHGVFNFDTANGCMVRLVGVSENLNLVPGIITAHLDDPQTMMIQLLTRGCVEFVSRREARYGVVALSPIDVLDAVASKGRLPVPARYELNLPSALFGYVAAITPFPEMNPTPRLIYVGSMSKQTMTYTSSNNVATTTYSLWYGQRPLVMTANELIFEFEPYGGNVVMAITSMTGKEQEDPVNQNRASSERGLLRCTGFRRYSESRAINSGTGELFEKPNPDTCLGMKKGVYDTLDEDGVVSPGCVLVRNSVIIGKTALMVTGDKAAGEMTRRDHSCQIKNTDVQDEDFGDTSGASEFRRISDGEKARDQHRKKLEDFANKRAEKRARETLGENDDSTVSAWTFQPPERIDPETSYFLAGKLIRQMGSVANQRPWFKTPGSEVPYLNCTRKPNSPCHAGPRLIVDRVIRGGKADSEFYTVTTRSVRPMTIGDKVTSRHGQKGTCASLTNAHDMPFCVGNELCHGITPDIVMGKRFFRQTFANVCSKHLTVTRAE